MKTVRDVMRHRGRGVIYSVLPIASVYEAIEKMASSWASFPSATTPAR